MQKIDLALQGGGSHGAFTWGVMHRLISEPRIYIDGLSGTSAGGMNAAVFADGFLKGKRQGAIDALQAFWMGIAELNPLPRSIPRGIPGISEGWDVDRDPTFMWLDFATRLLAPRQINPLKLDPLGNLLRDLVDFDNLRAHPQVKLFVTASNVRTCRSRIFRTPEISVEALMAYTIEAATLGGAMNVRTARRSCSRTTSPSPPATCRCSRRWWAACSRRRR